MNSIARIIATFQDALRLESMIWTLDMAFVYVQHE